MARTHFDTAGQILDRFFLKYDLVLTPVMAVSPAGRADAGPAL